jgi:hypothetical protein
MPIAATITEPVSNRKLGEIISHDCGRASCYQFFAAGALWKWISKLFWLEPLKLFFVILKNKFPLILKTKYWRFNGK